MERDWARFIWFMQRSNTLFDIADDKMVTTSCLDCFLLCWVRHCVWIMVTFILYGIICHIFCHISWQYFSWLTCISNYSKNGWEHVSQRTVQRTQSKSLRFDSYYQSYVDVLGKLFIPCCLCICLSSIDGYLLDWKIMSEWLKLPAYFYDVCAVFSLRR